MKAGEAVQPKRRAGFQKMVKRGKLGKAFWLAASFNERGSTLPIDLVAVNVKSALVKTRG